MGYIGYVVKHKIRVFVHCVQLGIPVRGLLHDLSKFSRVEYLGIGRQFYPSSPEERERNAAMFKEAKEHHRLRNKHEIDHWYNDDGTCQPIPPACRKEIVADWAAFYGFPFSKANARKAYLSWARNYRMHPETRRWFVDFLDLTEDDAPELWTGDRSRRGRRRRGWARPVG